MKPQTLDEIYAEVGLPFTVRQVGGYSNGEIFTFVETKRGCFFRAEEPSNGYFGDWGRTQVFDGGYELLAHGCLAEVIASTVKTDVEPPCSCKHVDWGSHQEDCQWISWKKRSAE